MRGFIILIVYFNYRKSLDSVPSFSLKTVQSMFFNYHFGSKMLDIQILFHGRTFNGFHSKRVVPDSTRPWGPWGPFDAFSRLFDLNTPKISLKCIIS